MSLRTRPIINNVAGGALLCSALLAAPAAAVPLVGVAGPNTLIQFDSAAPNIVTSTLTVTGLGGQVIRGIDFRPATGQLYALGQDGGLFTIDTGSGAASLVSATALPVTTADLDFGFAFNPVVDRIRTVTATDQNLRSNPNDATTLIDGTLAYVPGDPNAGVDPNVTGSAYTNQFAGATTTTLYGIDAATSALVLQNPPNNGGLNTIGALGVLPVDDGIGFDIDAASGIAFASLITSQGVNGLYTINLTTGAASFIGGFGDNTVLDIAAGSFAVPEPISVALLGTGLLGLGLMRRRASSS